MEIKIIKCKLIILMGLCMYLVWQVKISSGLESTMSFDYGGWDLSFEVWSET